MKFAKSTFEITKSYAKELDSQLSIFGAQTKTKKTLFLTLITTYGVTNGDNYPGLVQKQATMEILFSG